MVQHQIARGRLRELANADAGPVDFREKSKNHHRRRAMRLAYQRIGLCYEVIATVVAS